MLKKITKYICWSILLVTWCVANAQAQSIQVSGVVKDADGEAIPGVHVRVENDDKRGGVTTIEGRYTIQAARGEVLVFSFIGMQSQEVKVTGRVHNVTLLSDDNVLDEVVVTGYQKIDTRLFTGATSSVKLDEIKLEGVSDISRMLEGRMPGLTIQNISGSYGSAPRINIRGGASIIGNVQPLWVVDGVVYEDIVSLSLDEIASGDAVTLISSAIAGLNASDIEDVQVLKDASATSMYGARALNGVIVVTTRSAQRNAPNRFAYHHEQSYRLIPSYSQFDLLNSQETMSIYQEMERKGYFDLANTLYGRRGGVYYQWYKAISTVNPSTGEYYQPNTKEAKAAFMREHEYANTNWFKELFRIQPVHSHSLSFSAGGERSATYASIGVLDDMGWTIVDKVRRYTANVKNTFFFNDHLKSTVLIQGNIRKQRAPGTFSQRRNSEIGSFERDFDINPFSYALGTSRTLRPYDRNGNLEYYRNNWAPFNIINEYANNYIDIDLLNFKAQLNVDYEINSLLNASFLLSARSAHTSSSHYVKEGSNVIGAFRANENSYVADRNIYLLVDKDNPLKRPEVALTHGGIFNKTDTRLSSYVGRVALDYSQDFGAHNVKLFGFSELRYADRVINPFQGYGIQYDRGNQIFTNPSIISKLVNQGTNYFGLTQLYDRGVSFSLSGTYGYDARYVFNGVVSVEGANSAGQAQRSKWFPTWNVGGKWNVDRESFFDYDNINSLAVRASYGLTAKMNEYAVNSNAVFNNAIINRTNFKERENALLIKHLENRDLTWEKMYELNFGVDANFLDYRIGATLDFYQRNSFDLIDLVRTSGVGGEYYKYANFGDMVTRGMELALKVKVIDQRDFKWSSTLTLSYMNQKITRLLNRPNTFDMVAGNGRGNIVGYPKGALFSFNFQGVNKMGLPTFDFGLYPNSNRGNPEIYGADFADAQYSKSYLIYHGSVIPNTIGGLSNEFSYKGWRFSFFITAQLGNKIRLNPTFDPAFGDLNTFSSEYYDRWIAPGDELHSDVPALPSQDVVRLIGEENVRKAYNTYNYSQVRVVDGSFIRMKNIALQYSLPSRWLKKLKMQSCLISVQVANPFLIYADRRLKGQDPEFYKSGGVAMPVPKQYTLSLNINY